MLRKRVFIFDNKINLADFFLKKWQEIAQKAFLEKGYLAVALSGGKTPVFFYRKLKKCHLPWSKVHIFLADERFVERGSPDSNYGIIYGSLLKDIRIPIENIHSVSVDASSAKTSTMRYDRELRAFFKLKSRQLPRFDIVVLGVGEDGHVASLFPGTLMLKDKKALAISVSSVKIKHARISLSLNVINAAVHVFFLVTGRRKSAILEKILNTHENPIWPVTMVKPQQGSLFFLVDKQAASHLF